MDKNNGLPDTLSPRSTVHANSPDHGAAPLRLGLITVRHLAGWARSRCGTPPVGPVHGAASRRLGPFTVRHLAGWARSRCGTSPVGPITVRHPSGWARPSRRYATAAPDAAIRAAPWPQRPLTVFNSI